MKQSQLPDKRALFLARLEGVLKCVNQTPPDYVGGKQPAKDEIDAITARIESAHLWLRALEPYNQSDFPEIRPKVSAETAILIQTFNGIAEERKGNRPFDAKRRNHALVVLNKIATALEPALTARRTSQNTQPLRRDKP
jgi:hypothetical protein